MSVQLMSYMMTLAVSRAENESISKKISKTTDDTHARRTIVLDVDKKKSQVNLL